MGGLGLPEILIILLVVLLVFGAARLPEIGRSLGKALNEFKRGVKGDSGGRENQNRKEDS